MTDKQPIIDFEPTPGHILIKSLSREEVAALYNRDKGTNLTLPDNVGKVSDSVGVGRVILLGGVTSEQVKAEFIIPHEKLTLEMIDAARAAASCDIKVGDYIAHMPYTDLIIEIDGTKYGLLPYDKVWAVRKGE